MTLSHLLLVSVLASAVLAAFAPVGVAAGVGQTSLGAERSTPVVFRHDGDGSGTDTNADSLVQVWLSRGRWSTPENIGGEVHRDSEIGMADVQRWPYLAVRWNDNSIRVRQYNATLRTWNRWINTGVATTGGPTVAAYDRDDPSTVVIAYRTAEGQVGLISGGPRGPWSAPLVLPIPVAAGTAPKIVAAEKNKLSIYSVPPNFTNLNVVHFDRALSPSGPMSQAAWSAVQTVPRSFAKRWDSTPAVASLVAQGSPYVPSNVPTSVGSTHLFLRVLGAAGLEHVRPIEQVFARIGGSVASSPATARAGESSLANAPGASWASPGGIVNGDLTMRLDVHYRAPNGCLMNVNRFMDRSYAAWRTSWSTPAAVSASTLVNGRCVWPGRQASQSSRVPLMKRSDSAEEADLQAAHNAWFPTPSSSPVQSWFQTRYQAITLDYGNDWPTSWSPRNWHPNAWMYKKSTSFLAAQGVHTTRSDLFVRLRDGQDSLAAVRWGCTPTAGCDQPLLDVTKAEARNYWLYGSDGRYPSPQSAPTDCHKFYEDAAGPGHRLDGIVDHLVCKVGVGSAPQNDGGFKGVWLDDLLADLATSDALNEASHISSMAGVPVTNAELATKLPFTTDAWADGLATMIGQLRRDVDDLKAAGRIANSKGLIAANYKWQSFGFATAATSPTITAASPAGRIIAALDLVDSEGGWVDGGVKPNTDAAWSFARRQAFVDEVHRLGSNVLEEKVFSRSVIPGSVPEVQVFEPVSCRRQEEVQDARRHQAHYTTAQYNLASTLLNWEPGDWVGDMCDYYGRGWDGYLADLGRPLARREEVVGGSQDGVQYRRFEKGIVIVVPPLTQTAGSPATRTFELSDPFLGRRNDSTSQALATFGPGQITVRERTGLVLLNNR